MIPHSNWQYIFSRHPLCFERLDFQVKRFQQTFYAYGHFSYTFTQWRAALDAAEFDVYVKEFCDCLDDNFLIQHITTPTMNDKVITEEPDMSFVTLEHAPSDHRAFQWRVSVETQSNTITRCIFVYAKADYGRIKPELSDINRSGCLQTYVSKTLEKYFWNLESANASYVPIT